MGRLMCAVGLLICLFGTAGTTRADPVTLTVSGLHTEVSNRVVGFELNWNQVVAASGWDVAALPQVSITDQAGKLATVPAQLIRMDQGRDMLFWLMPGTTAPGQSRSFMLMPVPPGGDKTPLPQGLEGVSVRHNENLLIVSNGLIEVTHDTRKGGTITSIKSLKTGNVLPVSMDDSFSIRDDKWRIAEDQNAKVRVLGGETVLMIEAAAQFTHARQQMPRGIYRYIYCAGSPLVRIEVSIPRQEVAEPFDEVSLFTLDFGKESAIGKESMVIRPDGQGKLTPIPNPIPSMERPNAGRVLSDAVSGQSLAIITPLVPNYSYSLDQGASVANADLFTIWQGRPLEASAVLWFGPKAEAGEWVARCGMPTIQATFPAMSVKIEQVRQSATRTTGSSAAMLRVLSSAAAQRMAMLNRLDEADVLLKAAESFTPPRNNGIAVLEARPFVAMVNAQTGLLFKIDQGKAELAGLFSGDGHAFIRPDKAAGHSLWRASMQEGDQFGANVSADPAGAAIQYNISRPDEQTAQLTLNWNAVSAGHGRVKAQATVSLKDSDLLSRWRLSVQPQGNKLGLWDVWFPIVPISPDAQSGKPDFSTYPYKSGVTLPNPTAAGIWQTYYPGEAGWEFLAYWQGDHGMYLGAHDPEAASKYVRTFSLGDGALDMSFRTPVPDQGRPGAGFRMSYDVCLGTYRGDWYGATQIYRQWLLRQTWFPRQTLAQRQDTPQWVKDNVVAVSEPILNFFGSVEDHWPENNYLEYHAGMLDLNRLLGDPPTVLWWYHAWWGVGKGGSRPGTYAHTPFEPFPPDYEKDMRILSRFSNIHTIIYSLFSWWDLDNPDRSGPDVRAALAWITGPEPWIARKYGSQITYVCPQTKFYQQAIAEVANRLMSRSGPGITVAGTYFDLAGTAAVPYCYNPAHGHPVGAGAWRTEAVRKVIQIMRDEGRKHNPDFVVITEGNADTYLTVNDGYCLFQGNSPIRQALYGDYQRSAGGKEIRLYPDSSLQAIFPAKNFAWGAPIGRFRSSELENISGPIEANVAYYRRLVDTKRVASPWLNLGQMIQPLELTDLQPSDPAGEIQAASVPHATWKSPDGRIAFVFANARFDKPVSFNYVIDPEIYGIKADGSLALYSLTPDGSNPPEARYKPVATIKGLVKRHETLFPGGVLILVVK